jgi:hypothetical protein
MASRCFAGSFKFYNVFKSQVIMMIAQREERGINVHGVLQQLLLEAAVGAHGIMFSVSAAVVAVAVCVRTPPA